MILAIGAAVIGATNDFAKIGSPVALLLMVFVLTAHAGRSEAKGLVALTQTAVTSPWTRRAAFIIAGTVISVGLAIPASIAVASAYPVGLAAVTGAVAATMAIGMATLSGSAFLPRIVMLIVWYGYMAG